MTKFVSQDANGDYPVVIDGVTTDFLLAKYDGVRAYYAGCAKPYVRETTFFGSGGGLEVGKRTWAFVGRQVDAKGRVIYSEPTFVRDRVAAISDKLTIVIQCVGLNYGTLGAGTGGTLLTNGTGTNTTTLVTKPPHGVQPGDTLYYYETKFGSVPGDRGKAFDYITEEMRSVKVVSVRGANVILLSPVSYVTNQRFVANRTLLVLRTKIGGLSLYLSAEIPFPDFFLLKTYDGSVNETFTVVDSVQDSVLTEEFILPGYGFESTRSRSGTCMAVHSGRLCVGNGSNLFWSNPEAGRSSIEQTPLTNSINVGGEQGGNLTSLCSAGDESLYIFKKNAIYRLSGEFLTAQGFPNLKQSTVVEGELGAANNKATISFGGSVLAFGSGSVYAIRDGYIFLEIGKVLTEKLRGRYTDWLGQFTVDIENQQVKLWCIRHDPVLGLDVFPNKVESFVLDLKQADDVVESQSDITLSRSLFKGSWFRWDWKIGTPSSGSVFSESYNGREFYISQRALLASSPGFGSPVPQLAHDYQQLCGLWIKELILSSTKYSDGSKSIRNMINFTPIHKDAFDKEKAWVAFKLFRLISNSDLSRITDWKADVDLIFGFSNNLLTIDSDILKLRSSVGFSNIQETQSICPVSGNYSPSLEIKIILDQLYKSIGFSSMVIDHFEPFDTEGLLITSEN